MRCSACGYDRCGVLSCPSCGLDIFDRANKAELYRAATYREFRQGDGVLESAPEDLRIPEDLQAQVAMLREHNREDHRSFRATLGRKNATIEELRSINTGLERRALITTWVAGILASSWAIYGVYYFAVHHGG